MLYDGLGYLKEYQEITRMRQDEHEVKTKEEFLSKMRKEDRLHPIISVVIYYGEKEWDGPLSLKDMIVEMPKAVSDVFSDYKMNLVQMNAGNHYNFHNEDVRLLFEILPAIFQKDFQTVEENYRNRDLKEELIRVIGQITGYFKLMKDEGGEEGMANICEALDALEQKGVQKGIHETVLGMLELGTITDGDIMKAAKISKEQLDIYKKERESSK